MVVFTENSLKTSSQGDEAEIPGKQRSGLKNAAGLARRVRREWLQVGWWLGVVNLHAEGFNSVFRKIRKMVKIDKNMAFWPFWRALWMTSA